MRLITENFMTPDATTAQACADRLLRRYPPEGYGTSVTIKEVSELPEGFTHRISCVRWNSCD